MKRFLLVFSVLQLMICVVGCDGSGLVPVEGTVTYEGQPVVGLNVEFLRTESGRICTGYTDESGNFMLTASISEDGAMVGPNEVTFIFISDDTEQGSTATEAIQAIIEAHGEEGTPVPIEITGATKDLVIALPLE